MNYQDYKIIMKKEYNQKKKLILTTWFFLLLAAALFSWFFLADHQLVIAGAAFLLDLAGISYGVRAFLNTHPYWESEPKHR